MPVTNHAGGDLLFPSKYGRKRCHRFDARLPYTEVVFAAHFYLFTGRKAIAGGIDRIGDKHSGW